MPIINCPDCSKEMSDAAPACPSCGKPNALIGNDKRSVSILLGVGIFFMPIIFAWFTLRKGHTKLAKVISFVWLVVFLAIAGSGESAVDTAEQAGSKTKAKENTEKVMVVSINEILADYRNNEVSADNKYKGNLVQVTGRVDDIKKDILNNLYVTIGTGKMFEIPQVQAFFHDSMNNQLAQLNKGSTITVVCKVDGLMMNVIAKRCVIK